MTLVAGNGRPTGYTIQIADWKTKQAKRLHSKQAKTFSKD
jgi:hypothetical protein